MSLQLRRNSLEYLYHNITQNPRELLRLSGMPVRTFNRNMAKLRSEHHLTRVSGSGRPRIFKGDSQRQVVQFARRNPMWSAQRIANAVANKTNTLVSSRTIQRSLQRAGYIKLLPKKVPMLTPRHKQLRVEFSQRHRRRKFRNVFITDECMFQLHRNTVRQWCKSNQRPMKQVPKFAPSVMVWGALSCKGFYLKVLPTGTVTSAKYCQTLEEFLPFANHLYPRGWILQQDGASSHTAANTTAWLTAKSVTLLQWPPNSPDLSPIENVWQLLKDYVEKKSPTNVEELRRDIQESASTITRSLQLKLMNSLPHRLRACEEQMGDLVK